MDAFGNDLPEGNDFLAMDQSGPKEHLTGKMFDTVTGLYYFHARWYDPEAGRFLGRDDSGQTTPMYQFAWLSPSNYVDVDGNMGFIPKPFREGKNPVWFAQLDAFKLSREVVLKWAGTLSGHRYSCYGQTKSKKTASKKVGGLPEAVADKMIALSIDAGFYEGDWCAKCVKDPLGEFLMGDCVYSMGIFGFTFARASVVAKTPGPIRYPIPGLRSPYLYEWISEGSYFVSRPTSPVCMVGGTIAGAGCHGW
jgi:RHS repeat-associated protein